jgi:WD40 repeat protein
MASGIVCPNCKAYLKAATEPRPGTTVSCPKCHTSFRYQAARPQATPPPVAERDTTPVPTLPASGKAPLVFGMLFGGLLFAIAGGAVVFWVMNRSNGQNNQAAQRDTPTPRDGHTAPAPAPDQPVERNPDASEPGKVPIGPVSEPTLESKPSPRLAAGPLVTLEPIGSAADPAEPTAPIAVESRFQQHKSSVTALEFSPDGIRLASVGGDVLLSDVATQASTSLLAGGALPIVAFSSDGGTLVAGSSQQAGTWKTENGAGQANFPGVLLSAAGPTLIMQDADTVRIWNAATHEERFAIEADATAVALSPDGQLAVLGVKDQVRLFDVAAAKERMPIQGIPGSVEWLIPSADGKLLVCVENENRSFSMWNISDAGALAQLIHREKVNCRDARLSPDGATLAFRDFITGKGSMITLWDIATRASRGMFPGDSPVVFAADSQTVATFLGKSSNSSTKVCVVDAADGHTRKVIEDQRHEFSGAFALSPDGALVAIGCADGSIQLRRMESEDATGITELATLTIPEGMEIDMLQFSPDRRYLTAGKDDSQTLWSLATGKPLLELTGVYGWMFSPNGESLFASHAPKEISNRDFIGNFRYQLATGEGSRNRDDRRAYFALQASPDGRTVAAYVQYFKADGSLSDADAKIVLIDMATGEEQTVFWTGRGARAAANGKFAFSPDGKLLATDLIERPLKIFETDTGRERATNITYKEAADDFQFVDNTTLAAVDLDSRVYFFDVETGQLKDSLPLRQGHTGPVSAIAFSWSKLLFASVGAHGDALLRDVATGAVLARLPGHRGAVTAAAFALDGATLATASDDRVLKVWEIGDLPPLESDVPTPAAAPGTRTIAGLPFEVREYLSLPYQVKGDYDYLCFSHDGNTLAAPSDREILVWDLSTGQQSYPTTDSGKSRGYGSYGRPILAPNGGALASWGVNESGTASWLIAADLIRKKAVPEPISTAFIGAAAFSPDSKTLAVGHSSDDAEGKILSLVDTATFAERVSISSFDAQVDNVAWLPDGAELLAIVTDREGQRLVRLDPESLAERGTIAQVASNELFVSPDGRLVGAFPKAPSGSGSAILTFWEVGTGRKHSELNTGGVRHLSFVGDLSHVLTGSGAYEVTIWDVNTGQSRRTIPIYKTHKEHGTSDYTPWDLAVSADRRWMATGGKNGIVILWDLTQGRPVAKFKAHAGQAYGMAFSPDGRYLATAGEENLLKLWWLGAPGEATTAPVNTTSESRDVIRPSEIANQPSSSGLRSGAKTNPADTPLERGSFTVPAPGSGPSPN